MHVGPHEMCCSERVHCYMTVCMIQLVTEMTEWKQEGEGKSVRPVRFTSELTAEERREAAATKLEGTEASDNTSFGPKPTLCKILGKKR